MFTEEDYNVINREFETLKKFSLAALCPIRKI